MPTTSTALVVNGRMYVRIMSKPPAYSELKINPP
ncbi:hypothetical protein SBV1_270086 [Verrucomicrobia bacterium]|nr:hypothetical protein SBV1_270086 [Verrucomicrobiota bacterium]